LHSENPRLLLSAYTIHCCRAAAAAPARGSHGMDRGHARRLLFPFLIRLFLLFVRRRDEPPPPSGPCCRHCLVRPRGFHAIPLACFVCLLAEAGAARRGVGVAVGTAGRARQASGMQSLVALQLSSRMAFPLHATRWRGRRLFRSPLELDSNAARRQKGPGRTFDSFTDHMHVVRRQMPAPEDVNKTPETGRGSRRRPLPPQMAAERHSMGTAAAT
jgi:hypothetical protein